ncbi:hypothetical protein F511_42441 [Dorcoceras hygrometricum]|uniref:Uncharacterized protein n=1 Tax=Dorcoceras hygrometricum TaxID=472368 RepID=A0A2Z7DE26_9LAMI|nr:hypothetical protein F511_42441 [Dorcoceras hygrometricum]
MPPKRTRAQGTGETSNTESTAQGSENPNLTAAQIAQLVAATMEQILANRPEAHPQPDQQAEEIRKLRITRRFDLYRPSAHTQSHKPHLYELLDSLTSHADVAAGYK